MKHQGTGYYTEQDSGYDFEYNVEVRHISKGWIWELHYYDVSRNIYGDREIKNHDFIKGVENTKKEAIQAYEHEVAVRSIGEDYEEQLEELYNSL